LCQGCRATTRQPPAKRQNFPPPKFCLFDKEQSPFSLPYPIGKFCRHPKFAHIKNKKSKESKGFVKAVEKGPLD
jgi:hypothetical protein